MNKAHQTLRRNRSVQQWTDETQSRSWKDDRYSAATWSKKPWNACTNPVRRCLDNIISHGSRPLSVDRLIINMSHKNLSTKICLYDGGASRGSKCRTSSRRLPSCSNKKHSNIARPHVYTCNNELLRRRASCSGQPLAQTVQMRDM